MLPAAVARIVGDRTGARITGHRSVRGGCIAHAARVDTTAGPYFLKWSEDAVALTFGPEAAGLRTLGGAPSPLVIPKPQFVQEPSHEVPGILLMEWLETGRTPASFWEDFGHGLAALHRYARPRFGYDLDNFIGRLEQVNHWNDSWTEFFHTCRLEPQVRMARESGRWDPTWDKPLDRLVYLLPEILPQTPAASVLHGDLWSGNFLVLADGRPALIDPAVYFGHREADLAMTELFGGFAPAFYAAYRESWPFEPGYETRRDIYNLYHLVNHLNHFGAGYADSVGRILKRF